MKTIICIPARGGSKGVPRKNLSLVRGVSLLEWAIASTRGLGFPVVVSSDDDEILDVAGKLSAIPHLRTDDLAQDWTEDLPVAQVLVDTTGYGPYRRDDLMVWLRPTAPFRSPRDVKNIIEYMETFPDIDSLRSVLPAIHHPAKMYRMVGEVGNSQPRLASYIPGEGRANHPRQYLPPAWQSAGWIDAVRVRCIRAGSMEGDRIAGCSVPFPGRDRGFQIDTMGDIEKATSIATARHWTPGACQ
jgi:N-acylneuraminate cytidylyltransferase